MAVTDDERRLVARRLRKIEQGVTGAFIPTRELAENILRAIDHGRSGATTPYGCLADLIDPSGPKDRCVAEVKVDSERLEKLAYDAAVELIGIDRDALLALADECGDASRAYAGDGRELTSRHFANVARRIREACGVEP